MLGSKDKYEDVALLLRNIRVYTYKDSKALLWPSATNDLEIKSSEELLPPELVKFLNFVLSGDVDVDNRKKLLNNKACKICNNN